MKWKVSLYIRFIDLGKAYDSLDYNHLLWKILHHWGMPESSIAELRWPKELWLAQPHN